MNIEALKEMVESLRYKALSNKGTFRDHQDNYNNHVDQILAMIDAQGKQPEVEGYLHDIERLGVLVVDRINPNETIADCVVRLLKTQGKLAGGGYRAGFTPCYVTIYDSTEKTLLSFKRSEGRDEQAMYIASLLNSQGAAIERLKNVHTVVVEYCKEQEKRLSQRAEDRQARTVLEVIYKMLTESPLDSITFQHGLAWLREQLLPHLQDDLTTAQAKVEELEENGNSTDRIVIKVLKKDKESLTAKVASLQERLEKLSPLLKNINALVTADKEITSYPYWLIVDPKQNMSMDIGTAALQMTGPYFCRADAEGFLKQTRYNFGERAKVWCGSGNCSDKWQEFFKADRQALIVDANKKVEDSSLTKCPECNGSVVEVDEDSDMFSCTKCKWVGKFAQLSFTHPADLKVDNSGGEG